ncbi:lipoprotein releasing system transmembrane protein lolC [Flavobacterium saliperosum S13]|uniref:Lipoprotein-releasing system permease protein n=2 Tax=Flavobacterium saliperosum TaxID=329186 RepID=A0A1G4W7E5_9FLAO|nr:FtsX-like permease family protein [Flavobacterium saliperosum]ESU23049.1 lipoprotein releasing system transmembrane protein lolC [Flavobacterium saliperosum S13]SCX17531.1 lipoprotein-releasing system permease protein [Flavobacterium saliperosum]
MNFPFYIARRYTVSFSKSTAINIITGIATVGIVVSAMALFVVLSVFSGLREFSLSFANETDPDLKITNSVGKSLVITPEQLNRLSQSKTIALYSKTIEERVLFSFNGKQEVAYLKGVDSIFKKTNPFEKKIYAGQWLTPNTSQVVVGYGIANKLSMGLFDFNNHLEVFVPKPGKGTIENPNEAFNEAFLTPIGIYAINDDLDRKYVFTDLALAQELLQYQPNQVSAIELKLKSGAVEEDAVAELQDIFNHKVSVKTRAQLNDSLYKMLNTENIAVYLIFTLVIIVALFNLVGALIMMILDKKANLKTLFNLGAEIQHLRNIFLLQGSLLTFFGGSIGLLLGIAFVILQQQFALIMITPSMAYPIQFELLNIVIVLGTIAALGLIASWIASSRVSKNLLD